MISTTNKQNPGLGRMIESSLMACMPKPGDPINIEGIYYSGKNVILLLTAQAVKGYSSNIWGGFISLKAKGYQVRKGERATPIVFYKSNDDDGERVYRTLNVFNIEQCDKIEEVTAN